MPPAKGRFPRNLNTNVSEEAHLGIRGFVRHFEDRDYDSSKCAVVDAILRLALADPDILDKIAALLEKRDAGDEPG
jgi:hypothetical protein